MKKNVYRFAFILVAGVMLASLAAFPAGAGVGAQVAATPTLASNFPSGVPVQVVSFDSLNIADSILYGPFDSMTVSFGIPLSWQILDGAEIQLVVNAFIVRDHPAGSVIANGQPIGSTLDISYNGRTISSVMLKAGQHTYQIKIPVRALFEPRPDGRQSLYMFLNAGIDCDYDYHKTTVVVSSESKLVLPHADKAITYNLRQLPSPIYQRDSVLPGAAAVVLPDSPSIEELRSALLVSSAFGRMTGGQLPMQLVTQQQLTNEIRTTNHLIFIGTADDLTSLRGYDLVVPIHSNQFVAPGVRAEDGVVQLLTSPWNKYYTLMVIGGNSDVSVLKAAQAVSSGSVRTILSPSLATIASIDAYKENPLIANLETPITRTLTDLGYEMEVINNIGTSEILFNFYVQTGLIPREDPYFNFQFSHSALLETSLSGALVYINDVQIGSILFDEVTSNVSSHRITVPGYLIRQGQNQVRLEVTLIPQNVCSVVFANAINFSLFPQSTFHMMLQAAPVVETGFEFLDVYPTPLVGNPSLENLAFVLPENNPDAWRAAMKIANDIGNLATGSVLEFDTFFDGNMTEEQKQKHDLIFVGIPGQSQLLTDLGEKLPVPFNEDNSVEIVRSEEISYRIPGDVSLGYIQLLSSPWAPARSILAVLGTSPEGMNWAASALSNTDLRAQLVGNFAVVNDTQLIPADSRTGVGFSSIPGGVNAGTPIGQGGEEIISTTAQAPETATPKGRPAFILPAIAVLAGVMLLVIIVAAFSSRRKKI